jgi:hypothetical protein
MLDNSIDTWVETVQRTRISNKRMNERKHARTRKRTNEETKERANEPTNNNFHTKYIRHRRIIDETSRQKFDPKRIKIDEKSILGGFGQSGSLRGCVRTPTGRPKDAKMRARDASRALLQFPRPPRALLRRPGRAKNAPERFGRAPKTFLEAVRVTKRGRKRPQIDF